MINYIVIVINYLDKHCSEFYLYPEVSCKDDIKTALDMQNGGYPYLLALPRDGDMPIDWKNEHTDEKYTDLLSLDMFTKFECGMNDLPRDHKGRGVNVVGVYTFLVNE